MLELRLKENRIFFGDRFSVGCQRTLRIPDDGRSYPLPPGLGLFPVHRVADYAARAPLSWNRATDFFIPIYQREALWLGFQGTSWKPNAVKVGAGRVNAVSGKGWDKELHDDPQDYLVCPQQPWLDGINAGAGLVRQFVAAQLGEGYTLEAQITGRDEFGGIQLLVYEPKPGKFPDQPPPERIAGTVAMRSFSTGSELGLGVGGSMIQKLYPDPFGIDTWDADNCGEAFIHLVDSFHYQELTGMAPPPTPITAAEYTEHGLPWFELYDEPLGDVAAPSNLTQVESITELERRKGTLTEDENPLNIDNEQIKKLR